MPSAMEEWRRPLSRRKCRAPQKDTDIAWDIGHRTGHYIFKVSGSDDGSFGLFLFSDCDANISLTPITFERTLCWEHSC